MSMFVKVAKTHELAEGGMVAMLVGDTEILLAQVQGQYYAMSNVCSHASGGEISPSFARPKRAALDSWGPHTCWAARCLALVELPAPPPLLWPAINQHCE